MYQSMNRAFRNRIRGAMGLSLAVILLGACAAAAPPAPESSMAAAREAIAGAEQAGARQYAGAELDEAQQKLLLAQQSISNEQMTEAERLARESMIVADLASARTESAKAAEINREMRRSFEALVEEMGRTGDQQ